MDHEVTTVLVGQQAPPETAIVSTLYVYARVLRANLRRQFRERGFNGATVVQQFSQVCNQAVVTGRRILDKTEG